MPPNDDVATINTLAIQVMLNLPKLYGPNGFLSRAGGQTGGPPAGLVAALERLERATFDEALLATHLAPLVATHTITDLTELSGIISGELHAASIPLSSVGRVQVLLNERQYPIVADRLESDAKLFTPGTMRPPVTVVDPLPPPASGVEQYLVTNMTSGLSDWQEGQVYGGPVAKLRNAFVTITKDNINITATKPNNFIHAGFGDDAIDVSQFALTNGGTNVLDGGGGSNFLVGGLSSVDTFFVDGRGATGEIWSTVANFHKGDALTIYGLTSQAFALDWEDRQGAAGFTGLTLHATGPGGAIVSMTLAGYTKADLGNGGLSVSSGNDPASGSDYLSVQAN